MSPAKDQDESKLIKKIQGVLTPDLLQPQWMGNPNPLAGHCYAASESLFHMLGGREAGLKPYSAPCHGGVHWWLQRGSEILDPTGKQFDSKTLKEIHSQGRGRGFLTLEPSKRAKEIIRRVKKA
jgi:hypothetical protein